MTAVVQNKVFVSYNRKDQEIVVQAVDRLRQAGILTWFDRDDISAGEPWQTVIDKALRTSLSVAVFVGPHDTGSWQREEIGLAQQLNKYDAEIKIIPVLLPGAPPQIELPYFLSNLQYVDFTGPDVLDNETEFERLLAAIRRESLNDAEGDSLNEEKLRAAILDYYQSEEENCERLVFRPSEIKTKLKGSDVYVRLHLLSQSFDQSRIPVPRNQKDVSAGGVTKTQSTRNRVFSRVQRWFTKETRTTPPKDAEETVSRDFGERESWETVFRNSGLRLVFTGGAGSGKSFSLAQEIRKRLSQARSDLNNSRPLQDLDLPILVKANALVASPHERVADALLASLSESSYANSSHFVNWWRRAFNTDRGRRLFIVIDGLEELSEEGCFRKLMKQLDKLQDASVIITCRTTYFGSRRDWLAWTNKEATVVEIAPLNSEQQSELIAKWFRDDHRSRALASFLETNYFTRLFCRARSYSRLSAVFIQVLIGYPMPTQAMHRSIRRWPKNYLPAVGATIVLIGHLSDLSSINVRRERPDST